MRIQIDAIGAGLVVDENHFYESDAIPRVGESVYTSHLGELFELLGFPDDEEPWVVEEVSWYFGDAGDSDDGDVIVWVTHKHLQESLDAFIEKQTTSHYQKE